MVVGTYRGFPADGDPADGVTVVDPASTFTVDLYDHERELWADLVFRGEMNIHGFVIKQEDDTIEGVTVNGVDLTCSLTIDAVKFKVAGTFAADMSSLALDVQYVGTMTLTLLVEDPVDTGEDTGSDTGSN